MTDRYLSFAEALVRAQLETAERPSSDPTQPQPFTIAISREAGALGSTVAAELGRLLGWPVYDRNILDQVAEKCHRPLSRLDAVDERPTTWLAECVSNLVDRDYVASDAYLKHLTAVIRALGASGRCVIVGRGSTFLLPEESTVSVRLIAQPKDRVEAIARRLNLAPREAEAWMEQTERERAAFFRHAFGRDLADPHHYDLILNVSRLSASEAAAIIVETLRRRESRHARPSPEPIKRGAARGEAPALA